MTERTRYVDTHVHFWDNSVIDYPWLEGASPISHPHLPADLERARAGVSLELAAIVFEEADCLPAHALREAQWVTELAQVEPRIRGIVAHAPLQDGEVARPHLQALAELPLVKGIRRLIQDEPLGFCTAPDFVRGVQLLPEFGFNFDLCIYHPQLAERARTGGAVPGCLLLARSHRQTGHRSRYHPAVEGSTARVGQPPGYPLQAFRRNHGSGPPELDPG